MSDSTNLKIEYVRKDIYDATLAQAKKLRSVLDECCDCGSHPEGEKNWCAACVGKAAFDAWLDEKAPEPPSMEIREPSKNGTLFGGEK